VTWDVEKALMPFLWVAVAFFCFGLAAGVWLHPLTAVKAEPAPWERLLK
jgi:hypothetical protein